MKSFIILAVFLGLSFGAPNCGFNLLGYYMKITFMSLPWYPDLDNGSRQDLLKIVEDTNLTKAEMGTKIGKWAIKQKPEIQKDLEQTGKKFIKLIVDFWYDMQTYNFTKDAQSSADKIMKILGNDNITIIEEEKQTSDIVFGAPPKVQQELAKFLVWIENEYTELVLELAEK